MVEALGMHALMMRKLLQKPFALVHAEIERKRNPGRIGREQRAALEGPLDESMRHAP